MECNSFLCRDAADVLQQYAILIETIGFSLVIIDIYWPGTRLYIEASFNRLVLLYKRVSVTSLTKKVLNEPMVQIRISMLVFISGLVITLYMASDAGWTREGVFIISIGMAATVMVTAQVFDPFTRLVFGLPLIVLFALFLLVFLMTAAHTVPGWTEGDSINAQIGAFALLFLVMLVQASNIVSALIWSPLLILVLAVIGSLARVLRVLDVLANGHAFAGLGLLFSFVGLLFEAYQVSVLWWGPG